MDVVVYKTITEMRKALDFNNEWTEYKFCDRCSEEYDYRESRCPYCKEEKIKKNKVKGGK